jgi:hypothetical protein
MAKAERFPIRKATPAEAKAAKEFMSQVFADRIALAAAKGFLREVVQPGMLEEELRRKIVAFLEKHP